MNDDFNSAVGKISQDMRSLTKGEYWQEDLEVSLSGIEFTEEQIAAIKDAATPTVFQSGVFLEESFSKQLAHAFRDPITKSGLYLEHSSLGKYDDQTTMAALIWTRTALQDIAHNFPLILGDEMPGEVNDILDGYTDDIIPRLNERIEEIAAKTCIDPDSIELPPNGWEHISHLPEDVFTNG